MNAGTLKRFIIHPRLFADALLKRSARWFRNDKTYLSLLWCVRMGYRLDWEHPETFCEKMQWLKLNLRNPEYTVMADKVLVKEWVANRIGQEYVIPTLGVWKRAEDIDFAALPAKFVLKCNHNSGIGMYVCRDKNAMDRRSVLKGLRRGLRKNYYLKNREWPYKNIPPRIIAEQYMEDSSEPDRCLTDYKFYCFGGRPHYCQVIKDRDSHETIDFFDMEWQHQEFTGLITRFAPGIGNALRLPEKPQQFDRMKQIAETLSAGLPFSRIDLYEINGHIYFGEITFFPNSGMGEFVPNEYDKILGRMIRLPYESDCAVDEHIDCDKLKKDTK